MKVLVVEDEKPLSTAIKTALEKRGYSVTVVDNGHDAIQTIISLRPDIVLLDIILPGLSGWEIIEKIRKNSSIADTKIIVMSNLDAPARQSEFKRSGAIDYLVKQNSTLATICQRVALVLEPVNKVDSLLGDKNNQDPDLNASLQDISITNKQNI